MDGHPLTGPVAGRVWSLAWPVLLQHLLGLAVLISDRLLAGRFQDVDDQAQIASQAAQTTAVYLGWFFGSYTTLVTVGSTALVARCVGGGDRESAIRFTNQSLLLAGVLGVTGSILGILLLPTLTRWLGLTGPAEAFALTYLRPLFLFLPAQMVGAAGISCLAGAGDTRSGMAILGGVAVVNLPLAWSFFHGVGPLPGLGFPGIAIGTGVSHLLGATAVVLLLLRGRAGLRLDSFLLAPDIASLRRLLRVSVPAAADSLSVAVGQLWFVGYVNRLGDAAAAAHGIALGWEALGYLSGAAFGTAAMTLVGQNLGAQRPDLAARCGWIALGLAVVVMSVMGGVFFALAVPMFLVFCPHPGQQPVVEQGVPVLRLIAFAMPSLASCMVFTAALRGAGDTRVPVLYTWIGFFGIRIPLAAWLTLPEVPLGPLGTVPGQDLGLFGAWIAMTTDVVVRGCLFLRRFSSGRWQTIRV